MGQDFDSSFGLSAPRTYPWFGSQRLTVRSRKMLAGFTLMTDKRPHISADPHVLAAGLYRVFVGISPSTYTSWPARCPVPSICRHIAADPHVLARVLAGTEHLSVYRRAAQAGPLASTAPRICRHIAV